MKKVLFTLVAIITLTATSFACDLSGLMKGNTTLATKVRNMERQGYVLVMDQSFYNQHRYFVAPTAPYVDGFGQVVMRKSAGGYSLETEYVTISFDGNVKKNNKCSTSITDVTTQTVY